jgi:hypothetical protein
LAPGHRPSVFDACQFEIDLTQFLIELERNRSKQVDLGQLSVEVATWGFAHRHKETFFRRKA